MFFGFFHICDLGVSFTFHFRKKIEESSVIILLNGVLILNWKENKEAGAYCFVIRTPREKTKNYYGKSRQKFMEVILLWKETKTFSGLLIIPNIITEKWAYIRHINLLKKLRDFMQFLKYLAEPFLRPLRPNDNQCWIFIKTKNDKILNEYS